MKILIIDDKQQTQPSLIQAIRAVGHEVYVADTGEGGVALQRTRKPYDLVLLAFNPSDVSKIDILNRMLHTTTVTGETEFAHQAARQKPETVLGSLLPLADVERAHVELVMARTPSFDEAARVLKIDSATIYRKRKRWGILNIDPATGKPFKSNAA